ncbi:MAG: GNAT family protein [Myxococcota bacterium]
MPAPATWRGRPVAPVALRDPRVHLVPLDPSHAADLHAAGQDPEIWRHLLDGGAPFPDVAAAAAWIAAARQAWDDAVRLPFAVVDPATGRAVGSTSYYFEPRWPSRTLEVGSTWLAPSHRGTAVNPVAKALLLGHAFDDLGAERIELLTDARNTRSQRAIERLGARREGVLRRNAICADGFVRDTVTYAVLAEDWPAVREGLAARAASR